jgi:LuxR family maltose regulon positive regulatory protein
MSKAEIGTAVNMSAGNSIMLRPRVDTILSEALEKPITLVYAGEGCGKSYAVYSYLMDANARVTWIQLSESDNDPSRYWENVCNTVVQTDKKISAELVKMGFPSAGERYNLCYDRVLDELRPNEKYVLVFDDVHLIKNNEVKAFLLALVDKPLTGVSHVFISREETISPYDIGTSDEDFALIDEKDLLFTKVEVSDYLAMIEIEATPALVEDVYDASEGLPYLVNLASKIIRRRPEATWDIRRAIKRNITKLIDDHFFEASSTEMKKFFVKLSLLDHLSDSLVNSLPDGERLIAKAMKETPFIRYDTYMCAYRLHHLFLEFLRSKENLLTEEDKAEVYKAAAVWCTKNNYRLEAMGYYEKMGDYASIIDIAASLQLIVDFHEALYMLDIFNRMKPSVFEENPSAHVLYTRILLALGRVDEAIERLEEAIALLESRKMMKAECSALIWLYSNLGFAKTIKSTDTGEYDFARYYQKADEYFRKSGLKDALAKVNVPLLSYACIVGDNKKGEPEKLIAEMAKAIPFSDHALGGCNCGADDLIISEVAYYRGDMAACERYAIQSCMKARERGQTYIEGRALFLLLRMNLSRGRYAKIDEVLSQYDELVKATDLYIESIQQEVVFSWYYASIGETDSVAQWIKSDFISSESENYITGIEDLAKTKYYLSEKKYHALLAFLDRRPASHGVRRFLFGRIGMAACEAVCLYNLKDRKGALKALNNAYELSEPNAFDMPFIELGNNMRALTGAALRESDYGVPSQWLEQIRSKSATYAKRIAHVKSHYRKEAGKDGDVQLTQKEKEVLYDMTQGLSRTEIAAYRGVSVNTVKAMLQIIYEKLGADNSMDALRRAISENII